jgi:hypothetical protein
MKPRLIAILAIAWLLPIGLSNAAEDGPGTPQLCKVSASAASRGPVRLTRGINVTHWFRFPPSRDPAALAGYLSDHALSNLHDAGFDFVRLAVDPDIVSTAPERAVLVTAIRRIQRRGLAVVVSPHPHDWHLETDPGPLRWFWQSMAPALQPLDPERTVPEVLNEPVFPGDPARWAALQHSLLEDIRKSLPDSTVVLTGHDWGSISGLLALAPETDRNVLYSFHLYDPSELTSLAAYRPGLDRTALAQLPFPADNRMSCAATAEKTRHQDTKALMHFYCAQSWDAARINASLDAATTWARQNLACVMAGEFGASAALNPAAREAWIRTVRGGFETRHIPWALWGYDDVMGFAIQTPPGPGSKLDPALLSALGLTSGK